ncbi:MAG: hypothetical protein AAF674_21420 [Pseudomonadota bacterium]
MSKLDRALSRMDAAIGQLEAAIDARPGSSEVEVSEELPVLQAERDQLEGEVEALRARAKEDARLRSEAAAAVREALRDLRGAVGKGVPANA